MVQGTSRGVERRGRHCKVTVTINSYYFLLFINKNLKMQNDMLMVLFCSTRIHPVARFSEQRETVYGIVDCVLSAHFLDFLELRCDDESNQSNTPSSSKCLRSSAFLNRLRRNE